MDTTEMEAWVAAGMEAVVAAVAAPVGLSGRVVAPEGW